MNTAIVPVDFSEISLNAARFAAQLFNGHEQIEMLLYHCYEKDEEGENRLESLLKLKEELATVTNATISVLAEQGDDFVEELEKLSRHRQTDLIVMGITGKSAIAQVFMGSNAIKVAETKYCPVIIVPENCECRDIKNVLFTTDLVNVYKATPALPIKKVLDIFKPQLHIVNVNEEHYVALTEEYEAEKKRLMEMFAEYHPEFYFLRLFDVDEAINQFAEDKNIDLIISVHKEHSLLHRIFRSSHTKKLAYQSRVPLLVVHE